MSTSPNPNVIHAFLSDIHAAAANACEGLDSPGLMQLIKIHPATEKTVTVSGRFKIGQIDEMTALAIADAEGGHRRVMAWPPLEHTHPPRPPALGSSGDTKSLGPLLVGINTHV